MKKRILATALGLVLLIAAATAAFANQENEEWKVEFNNSNKLTSNYTLKGLGDKVYTMQPGDTVEFVLTLENTNEDSSNWYMTNEVLKTLEENATHGANSGAYGYYLTYTGPSGGTPRVLYDSERVGATQGGSGAAVQAARAALAGDSREGLENATEGLEDWLYLDTLASGARAVVRLRVKLDGESQINNYQATLARLQFNFAVDPVTEYNETRTEQGEVRRIVQTGDKYSAMPFIIAAGVSGLLLMIFGLWGIFEQKKLKKAAQKLACLALAGLLAVSAPAALGLSADAADVSRTYTVRLYPGAQGTFDADAVNRVKVTVSQNNETQVSTVQTKLDDNGVIVVGNVPYGSWVTFDIGQDPENPGVTMKPAVDETTGEPVESKYYVLSGVRSSGADNGDRTGAFMVTRDEDYVVAYGIKGQQVGYTLRFVDENGNRLADDILRQGYVGDKPVVAYQYIDGYRPKALNVTKTLEPDETQNIFTFEYTPLGTNVTTTFLPGGVTVIDLGGAGGGGGGGGGGAPAGPGGEVLPEPETPLAPPEEIVDLDEPETPLAGMMEDFATSLSGMALPVKIALAGGVIALGTFIILAIVKKRKKKEDAAES